VVAVASNGERPSMVVSDGGRPSTVASDSGKRRWSRINDNSEYDCSGDDNSG